MLNEAELLPQLFASLSLQEGVDFELVMIDGGSTDNTEEIVRKLADSAPFPSHLLRSPRGRACQMNSGARIAKGDYLLFLHLDSYFPFSTALQSSLAELRCAEKRFEGATVAARFRLNFPSNEKAPQLWRDFHRIKAQKNRRGAIHGDQGFLMSRHLFFQIGPFDESLPFLEDDRLSDKILAQGRWILLNSEIITSTRRFAREGYWQRDLLNMIILALHQSGYDLWLSELPTAYRAKPTPERIRIMPMLRVIISRFNSLKLRDKGKFIAAIGRCIRDNLWQLRLVLNNFTPKR